MEKKRLYQVSALIATAILSVGCSEDTVVAPAPQPPQVLNKPVVPIVSEPSGISLSGLKSSGASTISLKGPQSYTENEPVKFVIDTQKQVGYLYIIYVDNKHSTGLLYPNPNSPLAEMGGKYIFPDDFGNMNIRATKDCVGCSEERTTVYVLLSKEPITDIKNITYAQLMSVLGGGGGSSQSKGLSMDLDAGASEDNGNVKVGQFEFVVQ